VAGTLIGAGAATFLGAGLAAAHGALLPWVSWVALAGGAAAGVLAWRASRGGRDEWGEGRRPGPWDVAALACFAAAALRQFLAVARVEDGVLTTLLPNNYGDLPLHWTYVRYLANGAAFWPENPIVAGERLRYPFGSDLLTAQLVQLGLPLAGLLTWMGVGASLLAMAALFAWGRGFAVAAFLFSGSLAVSSLLAGGGFAGSQEGIAWKNLFLALFVPQRGFLFALPAGLLLLASGRERLLRGRLGAPAWVDGLLWGVMPLFHVHTFLFVSLVLGLWAVAAGRIRAQLPALFWAVAPATWGVWQVTDGFRAASLVWWKPGWTIGDANPVAFLAVNFGLFLPLALLALARAWAGPSEHRLTLGPALAFLATLFFVMLAPWDWDNTKVMLWCYLLALPGLWDLVLARLGPRLRAVALGGLLLPGAVAVVLASRGPAGRLEILDVAEVEGVCRALAAVPVSERVATVPTFNHPVALCGHPLVAGYPGHLWSHGIRADATLASLDALLSGAPGWEERAREAQAAVLFWGRREEGRFPQSPRPWEASRPLVAEGAWGRLYRLAP